MILHIGIAILAFFSCVFDPPQLHATNVGAVSFTKVPQRVSCDLGVLQAGKQTTFEISIKNESLTPLAIKTVWSDCGCIVGVLKDDKIEPSESTKLILKITPKEASSDLKRIVKLLGDKAEDRIEILFQAIAKPAVATSPEQISLSSDKTQDIILDLSANFGLSLKDAKFSAQEGSLFHWEYVPINEQKSQIRLRTTPDWQEKRKFGFVKEEEYWLQLTDGTRLRKRIQIDFPKPTELRPKAVTATKITDESYTFVCFITGEAVKAIADGIVKPVLVVDSAGTDDIHPEITLTPKVATCKFTLMHKFFNSEPNRTVSVVLVSASGTRAEVSKIDVSL